MSSKNGYTLVDFSYPSVSSWKGRITGFFSGQRYCPDGVESVSLQRYPGTVKEQVIPRFGPGTEYASLSESPDTSADSVTLKAGASVNIFFETNGWLYGEFSLGIGTVRAWVPSSSVGP